MLEGLRLVFVLFEEPIAKRNQGGVGELPFEKACFCELKAVIALCKAFSRLWCCTSPTASVATLEKAAFLLGVMRHPKTPATLRIKVALATQPYIHPRKSNRPMTPVAAAGDRHGFEVEPALAKKLRNEISRLGQLKRRRNPRPGDLMLDDFVFGVEASDRSRSGAIAPIRCHCSLRYYRCAIEALSHRRPPSMQGFFLPPHQT